MLGLVDDISEACFKAQHINLIMNVKTGGKGLQFGPTKCAYVV